MSTLVVIPARLGAVRLPQKPLRLLAGAPLIIRVWERVSRMNVADRCVVAVDDHEVLKVAEAAGAECVMTGDRASGTERVAEVASMPGFSAYTTIVNVQGDEPFIAESAVRGAAQLVETGQFDVGTAASPAPWEIGSDPNVVKVVVGAAGQALYFSRAGIPFVRDSGSARHAQMLQHIGVYAYRRDVLQRWAGLPHSSLEAVEKLEQLRALAAGIRIGVAIVDEPPASGIDTEDELAAANERWHEFIAGR